MKKTKSNIKSNAGLSSTKGLKNKLRIIAIVCLLIFAGYSGVNATIKLGTDGSGQYWGIGGYNVITNSNGKEWTVTGDNLQVAIWDLNTTGGTVWLGGDVVISKTIVFGDRTVNSHSYEKVVDLCSHAIEINADVIGFNMTPSVTIKNGEIGVSPFTPYTKSIINFPSNDSSTNSTYTHAYGYAERHYLDNLRIINWNYTGKQMGYGGGVGINISLHWDDCPVPHVHPLYMWSGWFTNLCIGRLKYGILMNNTGVGGNAWSNGNVFQNINFELCEYGVYMNRGTNCDLNGNMFTGLSFQPMPGYSVYGFVMDGKDTRLDCFSYDEGQYTTNDFLKLVDNDRCLLCKIVCNQLELGELDLPSNANLFSRRHDIKIHDRYITNQINVSTLNAGTINVNTLDITTLDGVFLPVSTDNLVYYYDFSEGTGTVLHDKSICRHDLDLAHNYSWINTTGGYALSFNDTQGYASCTTNQRIYPSANFTICAWVNFTGSSSSSKIVEIGNNGVALLAYKAGATTVYQVFFKDNSSAEVHSEVVVTESMKNRAIFLVGVANGTHCELYLDSVAVGSGPGENYAKGNYVRNVAGDIYIGADTTDTNYWNGSISSIMVFERALSQQEINTLYNTGLEATDFSYIQSNNFTVFDSDWHEYMKFPTTNTSTLLIAGQSWFNTATNVLNIYNGTAWVSTTLT